MMDAAFRRLQGQILQLVNHLDLTWTTCPRDFSLIPEEERDKLPHAHPTCSGGLLSDGYNKWTCDTCQGAGEVLAKKKPIQKETNA